MNQSCERQLLLHSFSAIIGDKKNSANSSIELITMRVILNKPTGKYS